MQKLPVVSGQKLVRALCNRLGFSASPGRGDHVILKGQWNGELRVFPVPLHKELARGTLRGIMKQAGISREKLMEILD